MNFYQFIPMKFPLYPLFLALVILVSANSTTAQTIYNVGETTLLPTSGNFEYDHATMAVNAHGDIVISNHTTLSVLTGRKAVESTVLSYIGDGQFLRHPPIVLGDSTLGIIGNDDCRKPDVEALSDGSFMVVWPRHDLDKNQPSRLETARIILRNPVNGSLYSQPIINAPQNGVGYLLDDNIDQGIAGVMPDIAPYLNQQPGRAHVVYTHESGRGHSTNNLLTEYEIREVTVDWRQPSTSANFSTTPIVLEHSVPFDQPNDDLFPGGLILPDAVVDDYGNLVVSWESYLRKGHLSYTGDPKGCVQLRRFSAPSSPTPYSLLNQLTFYGRKMDNAQRRPALSTSRADSKNQVTLGWGDIVYTGQRRSRLHFKNIEFTNNTASSIVRSIPWTENTGNKDSMPAVSRTENINAGFSARAFPYSNRLYYSYRLGDDPIRENVLDTQVLYPWRPAVQIVEDPRSNFAAVVYEGADTQDPEDYKLYLTIQRLR
jgi:hypothetical protein